MQRRRGLTAAAAVALLFVGSAVAAAPASAHESSGRQMTVTLKGNGSTASVSTDDVRAGAVRMTITGSASTGAQVAVVSLRHGASLNRFLGDLTVAAGQSQNGPAVAKAITDIQRIAVGYGGGDTLPGRSVTDTVVLSQPGIYYVTNVAGNGQAVSLTRLEVTGEAHHIQTPRFSATVTLGDEKRDVIEVTGSLPRSGTIRVANDGDAIHLLQISPVATGVTDAKVQAEYNQLMAGKTPTSDPAGLSSRPANSVGSDAVSPDHAASLTYHLPKGTYLLQCFVPDVVTGLPHTFMGMHKVVVIR